MTCGRHVALFLAHGTGGAVWQWRPFDARHDQGSGVNPFGSLLREPLAHDVTFHEIHFLSCSVLPSSKPGQS